MSVIPLECPSCGTGLKIDPDAIHIMDKSEYSGMFGDYSSFSEEYDELSQAESGAEA